MEKQYKELEADNEALLEDNAERRGLLAVIFNITEPIDGDNLSIHHSSWKTLLRWRERYLDALLEASK